MVALARCQGQIAAEEVGQGQFESARAYIPERLLLQLQIAFSDVAYLGPLLAHSWVREWRGWCDYAELEAHAVDGEDVAEHAKDTLEVFFRLCIVRVVGVEGLPDECLEAFLSKC